MSFPRDRAAASLQGRWKITEDLWALCAWHREVLGRRELPLGVWEAPAGSLSLARFLRDQTRDPFIVCSAVSHKYRGQTSENLPFLDGVPGPFCVLCPLWTSNARVSPSEGRSSLNSNTAHCRWRVEEPQLWEHESGLCNKTRNSWRTLMTWFN